MFVFFSSGDEEESVGFSLVSLIPVQYVFPGNSSLASQAQLNSTFSSSQENDLSDPELEH